MIVTTYSCDRCGSVVSGRDEITTVKIVVQLSWPTTSGWERAKRDFCQKCMKELGLHNDTPPNPAKDNEPPKPTFEDKLREIIREEISEAVQS